MHTYSTDNDLRPKVIGAIGVLSYLVLGGLEYLLSLVSETFSLGIVLGVPSWGLIFGILFTMFGRWGWNTSVSRGLGAVKVPDLNGKWMGWIETSYDGDPPIPEEMIHPDNDPDSEYTRLTARLEIEQTWRKMGVHFATDSSSSDSEGATVLAGEGKWPNLNYQYENVPPLDSMKGMDRHFGTADLELKKTDDGTMALDGLYYTGPRRENHGLMYFEKDGQ